MTDGMTEKDRKSQLLDFGLSTKVSIKANPYTIQLKCDGEEDLGLRNLLTLSFQEKFLGLII